MKILSSNVRGLGQSRAVRRLKNKLRHIQPQVLFLMDTKVTSKRMELIRRRYGFTNGIDIDEGGLSLGWKEGISLNLKSYSRSHIDVEVEEENRAKVWRFKGFMESQLNITEGSRGSY
ncbi:BEACH domain-containing lvsC [Gossypium australe]|uniref:BEACH domain-containing lvsC n=1 Tax=Gossypium australe TaxID=47621 RepID=A0A5B6V7V3_9ROSI|nr:BEACH domain-containing lvsC [Gossypium australe]